MLSSQTFSSPPNAARNDDKCGHNHKDNMYENLMKLDSSASLLITKYNRLRNDESRKKSKQFPIYTNSKLSLTSDSISIVLDLQDELACADDIESPYSKSVQRILNNFLRNGNFNPKQKIDSMAIEMLLVSLADRELLESNKQRENVLDTPGFEFKIEGYSESCSPERCYLPDFGVLSIDGYNGLMIRKHHIGGSGF